MRNGLKALFRTAIDNFAPDMHIYHLQEGFKAMDFCDTDYWCVIGDGIVAAGLSCFDFD